MNRRRGYIKVGAAGALLLMTLIMAWLIAPTLAVWSMAFTDQKGEESGQRGRARIVYFGERAIGPTITSIENHSPWVRRYAYLPSALKMIGGSAHQQLLHAIDKQSNPKKRACLISALMSAFDDTSHLETVMEDFQAGKLNEWPMGHLENDFRYIVWKQWETQQTKLGLGESEIYASFPGVPAALTEDKKLNPEFLAYYKAFGKQTNADDPRETLHESRPR